MVVAAQCTVLIPLGGKRGEGLFAIVDPADYEPLAQYPWFLGAGGYVRTHALSISNGRGVQMHVLIIGAPGVDHENRNRLDNRRQNLRPATRSQNNANRDGWASCGFKGVRQQSSGRFVARIMVNGKPLHLGSFDTAELAAASYDRAALEHFGEFARLNFPLAKLS